MLMNNTIAFSTTGQTRPEHLGQNNGICFEDFTIRVNPSTQNLIATGEIIIGDTTIVVHFADDVELIDFCNEHNIEFWNETL